MECSSVLLILGYDGCDGFVDAADDDCILGLSTNLDRGDGGAGFSGLEFATYGPVVISAMLNSDFSDSPIVSNWRSHRVILAQFLTLGQSKTHEFLQL